MARDRILNVVATGNYQTLGAGEGFPFRVYGVKIQVREDQVNARYKFEGQNEYFTIKAGTIAEFLGTFNPGDLQVLAAIGNTIELHLSTQPNEK
jgi:hypothetical protein